MAWVDDIFDRVWHVTRGNRGANEHVSVRSGIVFLADDEKPHGAGKKKIMMGIMRNGAPKAFRRAKLTWDPDKESLTGKITARGRGDSTTYRLAVTFEPPCNEQMIREGICGMVDRAVLKFEIEANPGLSAQGGGGGGTWHAED
jgi:hypothetical protein